MSVTVFIQGKNGVQRWQLGKRWMLLPTIALIGLVSLYHYSNERFEDQQANMDSVKELRHVQKQQILELKQATESQLSLLVTHVARLQAKMTRLEALGQQVADQNNLDGQFDFTSEVGVGGISELGDNIELDSLISDMDKLAKKLDP